MNYGRASDRSRRSCIMRQGGGGGGGVGLHLQLDPGLSSTGQFLDALLFIDFVRMHNQRLVWPGPAAFCTPSS